MNTPTKTIPRDIETKLTKEEIIAKATELANLHAEAAEIERELKEYSKDKKAEISKKRTAINQICKSIEDGSELRQLDCIVEKDFEHNVVKYLYNNEVVEERAMTGAERQEEMFRNEQAKEGEGTEESGGDSEEGDLAEQVFDESFPNA